MRGNRKDIIEKARLYLNDPDGRMWSDEELDAMLSDVVGEYSNDVNGRTSFLPVMTDAEGRGKYPECFVKFVVGYRKDGVPLAIATADEVDDLLDEKGESGYMETLMDGCYDASSNEIRVSTEPCHRSVDICAIYEETGNNEEYFVAPFSGSKIDRYPLYGIEDLYGIPTQLYGLAWGSGYGLVCECGVFDAPADIVFVRDMNLSEISDGIAIVYGLVAMALSKDTEFKDSNKAGFYRSQYEYRVAAFNKMAVAPNTRRSIGAWL